jgi:hypothetical protein
VSIAARPLFEALGFCVDREQIVEQRGVAMRNFRMSRNADTGQRRASRSNRP